MSADVEAAMERLLAHGGRRTGKTHAREVLDAALAQARREGQRDGWDEGYEAGFSRSFDMLTGYTTDRPTNPYRDNQTGATR